MQYLKNNAGFTLLQKLFTKEIKRHDNISVLVVTYVETAAAGVVQDLVTALQNAMEATNPATSEQMLAACDLSAYETQDDAFTRELKHFIQKQFHHLPDTQPVVLQGMCGCFVVVSI